ncbi:hypothetical protein D3C86_1682250 [compost metagenome]
MLPLTALPLFFSGIQSRAELIHGTEYHQLSLALKPGSQIGTVLAAQGGQLAANRLAGTVKYRRHQQQQQQQDAAQRQGQ